MPSLIHYITFYKQSTNFAISLESCLKSQHAGTDATKKCQNQLSFEKSINSIWTSQGSPPILRKQHTSPDSESLINKTLHMQTGLRGSATIRLKVRTGKTPGYGHENITQWSLSLRGFSSGRAWWVQLLSAKMKRWGHHEWMTERWATISPCCDIDTEYVKSMKSLFFLLSDVKCT